MAFGSLFVYPWRYYIVPGYYQGYYETAKKIGTAPVPGGFRGMIAPPKGVFGGGCMPAMKRKMMHIGFYEH